MPKSNDTVSWSQAWIVALTKITIEKPSTRMTTTRTVISLTVALVLLGRAALAESTLSGRATAVSGDALEIAGQRIRLAGIQAPPPNALCEGKITQWPCGMHSRSALAASIDDREVECRLTRRDGAHDRRGWCRIGGVDVAENQLRIGWARTAGEVPSAYAGAEAAARAERRGIWRNE